MKQPPDQPDTDRTPRFVSQFASLYRQRAGKRSILLHVAVGVVFAAAAVLLVIDVLT